MKPETIERLRQRNAEMVRMFDSGMDIAEIGKHFDVTQERVRQIIAKVGRKSARPSGPKPLMVKCKVCGRSIRSPRKSCSRECMLKLYESRSRVSRGKLTEGMVREVMRLHKAGRHRKAIADQMGVKQVTIEHLLYGYSWWWVTGIPRRARSKPIDLQT